MKNVKHFPTLSNQPFFHTLYRLILAVFFIGCVCSASAQVTYWTGAVDDDWHNAGNWDNGVPDLTKIVAIIGSWSSVNPIIKSGKNAEAKHVLVSIEKLTIESNASLKIESAEGNGFDVQSPTTIINHGEIFCDGQIFTGLSLAGSFINYGTLKIGSNESIGQNGIRVSEGNFTNETTGEIHIDDTGLRGIFMDRAADLINKGKIFIGSNKSNLWGIFITGDFGSNTLINESTGEITIDDCNRDGIEIKRTSYLTNYGKISIGVNKPVDWSGIYLNGIFGGVPSFTNHDDAEIIISETGISSIHITSGGVFQNNNCAVIEAKKRLQGNFSNATNYGFISCENGVFGFHNNGVIYSSAFSFSNNVIVVKPKSVTNCPSSLSPAFDFGSNASFYTVDGIFHDAAATQSAGTYDQNTNTFTPDGGFNAGLNSYYVKVTRFNCHHIGEWTVDATDTAPPTALCKSLEAPCSGGNYTIDPADIDDGSFDDCGIQSLSVTPATLSCSPGTHNVTLNVTDTAGKTTACQTTVTLTVPGSISINDITKLEGNGFGFNFYLFQVTRTPTTELVSVQYATANGTAMMGSDYLPASGTLYFPPSLGPTKNIVVLVKKDNIPESDETFFVNLSNAVGGSIVDGQGLGTILNDDGQTIVIKPNHNTSETAGQTFSSPEVEVTVFPNPVRDYLNIQLENEVAEGIVSVSDIYGKTVWQSDIDQSHAQFEIPTFDWARGTYLVHLIQNKQVKSQKIIVQ